MRSTNSGWKKVTILTLFTALLHYVPVVFASSSEPETIASTQCKNCDECCHVKQMIIYQSCIKEFDKKLCEGTALTAYNSCNNEC